MVVQHTAGWLSPSPEHRRDAISPASGSDFLERRSRKRIAEILLRQDCIDRASTEPFELLTQQCPDSLFVAFAPENILLGY